tara:strand:+ start:1022 stop:1429 length:408 start_codon:yes stop_codon:yes gene_type:complete
MDVATWHTDGGETFILRVDRTMGLDGVMYYYRVGLAAEKVYLLDVDDVDWVAWPEGVLGLVRLPVAITDAQWRRCRAEQEQFYLSALAKTQVRADWATACYADEIKAARGLGMDFTHEAPPARPPPVPCFHHPTL